LEVYSHGLIIVWFLITWILWCVDNLLGEWLESIKLMGVFKILLLLLVIYILMRLIIGYLVFLLLSFVDWFEPCGSEFYEIQENLFFFQKLN